MSQLLDKPMDLKYDLGNKTGTCNVIIEIPMKTNRKMEMSSDIPGNIIVQDKNKTDPSTPRYVPAIYNQIKYGNITEDEAETALNHYSDGLFDKFKACFGDHLDEGYSICHYGAIPQTYEDPTKSDENLTDKIFANLLASLEQKTPREEPPRKLPPRETIFGDGDPLDVCILDITDTDTTTRDGKLIKPLDKFVHNSYAGKKYYDTEKGIGETKYARLITMAIQGAATPNSTTDHYTRVHILGVYPMIDGGEIDWKVLACTPAYYSGYVSSRSDKYEEDKVRVKEWFKYYKYEIKNSDSGETKKVINLDTTKKVVIGDLLDLEVAIKVINHCKGVYQLLKQQRTDSSLTGQKLKFWKSIHTSREGTASPGMWANYYGGGRKIKVKKSLRNKKKTKSKRSKGNKNKSKYKKNRKYKIRTRRRFR